MIHDVKAFFFMEFSANFQLLISYDVFYWLNYQEYNSITTIELASRPFA